MTPRPALTAIQRYDLTQGSLEDGFDILTKADDGELMYYADHVAALAALASQEQRRVVEAKIALLEELAKEMCEYCEKSLPFTTDPLDTEALFHDNEEGGVWNCWCPEIHARLDRLRKGIA